MPGAPDIGGANDDPRAGQVALAEHLLGHHFALPIDSRRGEILVVTGKVAGTADKLAADQNEAAERRNPPCGLQQQMGALHIHSVAGFRGGGLLHIRPRRHMENLSGGKGPEPVRPRIGLQKIRLVPKFPMIGMKGRGGVQIKENKALLRPGLQKVGADKPRSSREKNSTHDLTMGRKAF